MREILLTPTPLWHFLLLLAYFISFVGIVVGVFRWQIYRRKERLPEEFKLLRGPGESLRRRVQLADENFLERMIWAALGPLVIGAFVFLVVLHLPTALIPFGVILTLVIFIGAAIAGIFTVLRFLKRRRNDMLGYLGERAVAEHLETLIGRGYWVFHDVPAVGKEKNFNLDHVVIGPTGVAVIETKTRRKRKAREGFLEHEVAFDGKQLIWPWGEDTHGLDQVQAEADWLQDVIEKRVGLRLRVKCILAIPGWYVKERALGAGNVRVANQKMLPEIVVQWKPQQLTAEQVDLIRRQLDVLCRDVED